MRTLAFRAALWSRRSALQSRQGESSKLRVIRRRP